MDEESLHSKYISAAYTEAQKSYAEGGLPIGSVLIRKSTGEILGSGHNMRVQEGNPIKHGEMEALSRAGRQKSYKDTILYTTLSPCMMCSGTIVQFKIPLVVVAENVNFGGNEQFLREKGVEVLILGDENCTKMMADFIKEKPQLWMEDIAEEL